MARKKYSAHKIHVGRRNGARKGGKRSMHFHAAGVKPAKYKVPALHTR